MGGEEVGGWLHLTNTHSHCTTAAISLALFVSVFWSETIRVIVKSCFRSWEFDERRPTTNTATNHTLRRRLSPPEVLEVLRAQLQCNWHAIAEELPKLWARWDPNG